MTTTPAPTLPDARTTSDAQPRRRHRSRIALFGLIAALALIAAACGKDSNNSSGGAYGSSSNSSTTTPAAAPAAATWASGTSVAVATTSLGQVIVGHPTGDPAALSDVNWDLVVAHFGEELLEGWHADALRTCPGARLR